jgi:hypothetical protein
MQWIFFEKESSADSWNGLKLDDILRSRMHLLTFAWLHTKQTKFSQQQHRGVYVANQNSVANQNTLSSNEV